MKIIDGIRIKVMKHLCEAYDANKSKYDRRANENLEYRVGESIYRRNMRLLSAPDKYTAKFGPKYIPTVVRKKMGSNTYELEDIGSGRVGVYHTRLLKR